MSKSFVRAVSALAAGAALTAGAVATAAPAGAATAISNPRLTVVCSQPHFGRLYSAVRFRQHGRWGSGDPVTVTLTEGSGEHVKVELHKRTGPHGWFRFDRTLYSSKTGPWIAGASYTWTTTIIGDAAIARRGTVTLTTNC